MPIQYAIQHHPSRKHLLPALLAALPPDTQVVADPDPGGKRSPWRTYQACLRAIKPETTHLAIIQDDAEPCLDLAEAVTRIAQRHPKDPIALFTPGIGEHRRRILNGCAEGKQYVQLPTANSFVPCVAMLWPAEAVAEILAWAATYRAPSEADDGALGQWIARSGRRLLATVPSLVEHPDRERSLVGKAALAGRNPARRAACWLGPDVSPLTIPW